MGHPAIEAEIAKISSADLLSLATRCQSVARKKWAEASAHDGIDPAAPFVVHSEDNPHIPAYNAAMEGYFATRQILVERGVLK